MRLAHNNTAQELLAVGHEETHLRVDTWTQRKEKCWWGVLMSMRPYNCKLYCTVGRDQSDPRLHPAESPRSLDCSRVKEISSLLPMSCSQGPSSLAFRRCACNIAWESDVAPTESRSRRCIPRCHERDVGLLTPTSSHHHVPDLQTASALIRRHLPRRKVTPVRRQHKIYTHAM